MNGTRSCTLFLLSLLPLLIIYASSVDLHPLILVPGQSGNQLEARLTDSYKPSNPFCAALRGSSWFRLWMDQATLREPFLQCFADQMRLYYDPDIDDYRNAVGIETRVPSFGSTQGFRYIDPDLKHLYPYMASLLEKLEQIGYKDGINLFGAPYDFRYGLAAKGHPSQVGSQFLRNLKKLVEEASNLNDNKPVIILTHSLGGLLTLQLLNRNSPAWSRHFIKHFIALAAPWGGTVIEMEIFASGSTAGFSFVNPLVLRQEISSSESNLWLLPNPRTFGNRPLVISRDGTFSAHEMAGFLEEIGFGEGVGPYESRILPLVEQLDAPRVPVTCMTGFGVPTPETLVYRGERGFDEWPEVVYGDGDGLVNLVSLLALEKDWANMPKQVVKVVKLANVSHSSILTDEFALEDIIREICDVNSFVMSSSA